MGIKQTYKTYERGQRIQDTNLAFNKGMLYSNEALTEGFSRLLINMDLGVDGTTLRPRKGIETTDSIRQILSETNIDLEDPIIVGGNIIGINNVDYYQIIIAQKGQFGSDLGDLWAITRRVKEKPNISSVRINRLTRATGSEQAYFSVPEQASIHGIILRESNIIQQIGTFAYNGSYFYFCNDGNLYHTYFNLEDSCFKSRVVSPYIPYQSETQNSLYNMLLTNPYKFDCKAEGTVLRLTGFVPGKSQDGNFSIQLHPQNGVRYDYQLYYTYPEASSKNYYLHIEYNTGLNSIWHTVNRDESTTFTTSATPFIIKDVQVDSPFAQFRIYAVEATGATENLINTSKQLTIAALANAVVMTASFNYIGKDKTNSTTNTGLVKYNLSHSKGITYWKNRLFTFGAVDRDNGIENRKILFASEVNRPDWFPYTAGAEIFDEDIIALQPMLDTLLVFTKQNLYSLSLSEDGLGFIRKHLQSNLSINPWDTHLIQIVKNMVFFKSGNYYFMVVPKLSPSSGMDLAIAPISKPITYFLNNFEENVNRIFDNLYNYGCQERYHNRSKITNDLELVHYYNYLDYEDVHNNYVFKVTHKEKIKYDSTNKVFITTDTIVYLNFELLYNIVNRTWRVYMYESQSIRKPFIMNSTGRGSFIEASKEDAELFIQILKYSDKNVYDSYLHKNSLDENRKLIIKNWQLLDTGNIRQNLDMKKRFREYQFKMCNNSGSILDFYSGFLVDHSIRTYELAYFNSDVVYNEDENLSVNVVEAIPMEGLQGPPNIIPEPEEEKDFTYTILGSWKLGISKLGSSSLLDNIWKIRVPTSGKGYTGRIILVSYNEQDYTLISCSTVYRQLYSR